MAIAAPKKYPVEYISLTTHADGFGENPLYVSWGAATSEERKPVIGASQHSHQRNCIGAHGGSYSIYRGLAVACGQLNPEHIPNLTLTKPVTNITPSSSWFSAKKICTMDPFGHIVADVFKDYIDRGWDIRPTIAITKGHIDVPEIKDAIRAGRLTPDGVILSAEGQCNIIKAAVEPVWYLPEVAVRFGTSEAELRCALYSETNGMYPELITRQDLKIFMPPIGGLTAYIFGDPDDLKNTDIPLTCRVHDECNGSDVFGSDICTCRPYLTHAIEEAIRARQNGGVGLVVYFRKEGRALGEVTKFLVYNLRKRQEGGDRAEEYFNCTRNVAGITDTRFQTLMPDVLHWFGIRKIHRLVSMSDMKYNAIVQSGIEVGERIPIPEELVPLDAKVEIFAKVFEGYYAGDPSGVAPPSSSSSSGVTSIKSKKQVYKVDKADLQAVVGRDYFAPPVASSSSSSGHHAVDDGDAVGKKHKLDDDDDDGKKKRKRTTKK